MKFKIFCSVLLLFSQMGLFGHNPLQSSLKLSVYEHSGMLEINLAQYGVEMALLKKYPNLDLKTIELKDYKELIITYLKENIHITADGHRLKMGKGVIKLGSHQTDLRFQIENMPENAKNLAVKASCFQENENQQNFFRIVHKQMTAKAKLNHENQFTSDFTILGYDIMVNDQKQSNNSNAVLLVVGAIAILSIIMLLAVRYQPSDKMMLDRVI